MGISGSPASGKHHLHHPRLAAGMLPSFDCCAPSLHPATPSPADVALFLTSPGAAEGSVMGNPTPSDPQAEGRPGNSLRGLPASPAALY